MPISTMRRGNPFFGGGGGGGGAVLAIIVLCTHPPPNRGASYFVDVTVMWVPLFLSEC